LVQGYGTRSYGRKEFGADPRRDSVKHLCHNIVESILGSTKELRATRVLELQIELFQNFAYVGFRPRGQHQFGFLD
jgi:hypothetical protein